MICVNRTGTLVVNPKKVLCGLFFNGFSIIEVRVWFPAGNIGDLVKKLNHHFFFLFEKVELALLCAKMNLGETFYR